MANQIPLTDQWRTAVESPPTLENEKLNPQIVQQLLEEKNQISELQEELNRHKQLIMKLNDDIVLKETEYLNLIERCENRVKQDLEEVKQLISCEENARKSQIAQEYSEWDVRIKQGLTRWVENIDSSIVETQNQLKQQLDEDRCLRNEEMMKWRHDARQKLAEVINDLKGEGNERTDEIDEMIANWEKSASQKMKLRESHLEKGWQDVARLTDQHLTDWRNDLQMELERRTKLLENVFDERVNAVQQDWKLKEIDRQHQFQMMEKRMRSYSDSSVSKVEERVDEMGVRSKPNEDYAQLLNFISESWSNQKQQLEQDFRMQFELMMQQKVAETDKGQQLQQQNYIREEMDSVLKHDFDTRDTFQLTDWQKLIVDCIDRIETNFNGDIRAMKEQLEQCAECKSKYECGLQKIEMLKDDQMMTQVSLIDTNKVLSASSIQDPDVTHKMIEQQSANEQSVNVARQFKLEWMISNFTSKTRKGQDGFGKTYLSPILHLTDAYKMNCAVMFEKEYVSVYFEMISDHVTTSHPIFWPKCTFTILDRGNQTDKKNLRRTKEPEFGTNDAVCLFSDFTEICRFPYHTIAPRTPAVSRYVKSDRIMAQLIVEPMDRVMKESVSRNGVLLWTIDNFRNTLTDLKVGIDEQIESESFYSSSKGYRFRVSCKWKSEFQVVEFYLTVLCGEFDVDLPKSFSRWTTFLVLDQGEQNPKSNVIRTEELFFRLDERRDLACSLGSIPVSMLENSDSGPVYLKDNVMKVEVTLENVDNVDSRSSSGSGVLWWDFGEYQKLKTEFLSNSSNYIESESFDSCLQGYTLRAYAQWLDNSFVLGLFFLPRRAEARTSFAGGHKIIFNILDRQNESGRHLEMVRELDTRKMDRDSEKESFEWPYLGCYEVKFPLTDLEKSPFMVNGGLLIKVTVLRM